MIDKDYRYIAARCSQYHKSYIVFTQHVDSNISKASWLLTMGLIETWDILK